MSRGFYLKGGSAYDRARFKKLSKSEADEIVDKVQMDLEKKYIKREREQMKFLMLMVEEALKLEFGFADKRLGYFLARFQEVADCISQGYIDIKDLEEHSYIGELFKDTENKEN